MTNHNTTCKLPNNHKKKLQTKPTAQSTKPQDIQIQIKTETFQEFKFIFQQFKPLSKKISMKREFNLRKVGREGGDKIKK